MRNKAWGLAILFVGYCLVACSPKTIDSGGGEFIPTLQSPQISYCSSQSLSGVTISGSAAYEYRNATVAGLGTVAGTRPIRYAEVRVTSSNGDLVQCTETDSGGNY